MTNDLPIGIFDSGVGGLTVLHSLHACLPNESYLYLGDTARLPYGTKDPSTVTHYALKAAQALVDRGIKLLVVACNTASSVALTSLASHFPELPVMGVIEPSAKAACAATRNQHIAVIATEATVKAKSYHRAIKNTLPQARVSDQSCSLFIALAEEGWAEDEIAVLTAEKYLTPLLQNDCPDVLILGCTHFPLLQPAITRVIDGRMQIVNSALATANEVAAYCQRHHLLRENNAMPPTHQLFVTDNVERFNRVAAQFLQEQLMWQDIQLVDL